MMHKTKIITNRVSRGYTYYYSSTTVLIVTHFQQEIARDNIAEPIPGLHFRTSKKFPSIAAVERMCPKCMLRVSVSRKLCAASSENGGPGLKGVR